MQSAPMEGEKTFTRQLSSPEDSFWGRTQPSTSNTPESCQYEYKILKGDLGSLLQDPI